MRMVLGGLRKAAVAAAIAVALSGVALADATVSGTVTSGGTAVAGAFVAITGANGQYGDITDAAGAYAIDVATGTYTVAAQAQGYAVAQASGVAVAGSPVTQDLALTASGSKFEALGVFGGQISGVAADGKSGVFYASTSVIPQVYRTSDYGGSWAPVTLAADDATNGLDGSNSVGGLVASGYPGELAVVVNGSVSYSRDFGVTWKKVTGPANGMPLLYWGHAATGAPSTLVVVDSGTGAVKRADMSVANPALGAAMSTGYVASANDKMAVANAADGSWVAVVTAAGDLKVYTLNATDDPPTQVGATLSGVLANPTFVKFGGAKAAGTPPAAVLVYSADSGNHRAVMATKDSNVAAFVSGDLSNVTSVAACGAGPGAVGSISPLGAGDIAAGTVSQCYVVQAGAGDLDVDPVNGINNNTGLVFDAGYGGLGGLVMISADGNRGLVKSAQAVGGVPSFPSAQEATAGTGAGSGGISVNGFNVAVVKDTVFGPAGASQLAVILSGSGGALSLASDDGGATFVPVVQKGGRAAEWWSGDGGTSWLVFGYGGGGDLIAAATGWTSATSPLPGPNVAGTSSNQVGAGAGGDVTALEGVPGANTLFIGAGENVDQQGTVGGLKRGTLTPGTPPTISGLTDLASGQLNATVRALAYCGTTGSAASIADVLLVATGTGTGGTTAGSLVRVEGATGGSPAATVVASVPTSSPVNDVRADCATGTVYAGTGSNGGGPSGAFYKSTDGGAVFVAAPITGPGLPPNLNVQVVAVNPSNGDEVLIAGNSEGHILRSTDAATSWTVVNSPTAPGGRNFLSEGVGDLEIPPASAPVVAGPFAAAVSPSKAAVGTGGGLFAASILAGTGGGACTVNADCADTDACTTDGCANQTCTNAVVGATGINCEIAALLAAGPCGTEKLDKKLKKALKRGGKAAQKAMKKVAKGGKKAAKAKKAVQKSLNALSAKIAKSKASTECKTTLSDRVSKAVAALNTL
jgi:hypothetical protein